MFHSGNDWFSVQLSTCCCLNVHCENLQAFPGYQGVSCRSNYYLCLVALDASSNSCLAFLSPVILPRVMLSWAAAGKKKALEMLSPKRCVSVLQRIKISAGTSEHCSGFQSTTQWGTSYSDGTTGSSWWKKMSHYLLQDKTKDFAGISKEMEDKKSAMRIITEIDSASLAMTC